MDTLVIEFWFLGELYVMALVFVHIVSIVIRVLQFSVGIEMDDMCCKFVNL